MASIVEYNGRKQTANDYPDRIVSPPNPSGCCFANMKQVGGVEEDGNWLYIYKRCGICGYTVRHFLMMSPRAVRRMRDEIMKSMN